MTKIRIPIAIVTSLISVAMINHFTSFSVFAEGPVDISIVELVDDGSGGLQPWQDITNAMPGETYSAIPRVKNDGTLPAIVWMCVSESAINSANETVAVPSGIFGLNINEHWVLDTDTINAPDLATGKCYKYDSMLEVGELTEPLFYEVTLSSNLGNEYQNHTFNLHLTARAIDELEDDSETNDNTDTGDDGGINYTATSTPDNPNTGANTASYLDIVSPLFFSAIAIAGFAIVAYVIRIVRRRR